MSAATRLSLMQDAGSSWPKPRRRSPPAGLPTWAQASATRRGRRCRCARITPGSRPSSIPIRSCRRACRPRRRRSSRCRTTRSCSSASSSARAMPTPGPTVVQNQAKAALTSFTNAINTALDGAHLFAGINADVKPVADYYRDSDRRQPAGGRGCILRQPSAPRRTIRPTRTSRPPTCRRSSTARSPICSRIPRGRRTGRRHRIRT